MGAWGHGNLENDGAQDLIAEISDELFARIVILLQNPSASKWDECEHDELFVRVEMILAMAKHGMINSSPRSIELEPLFAPFVERWSQYFIASKQKVPEERKAVIVDTFARLLEVASGAEEGSFEHRLGLISQKMGKNEEQQLRETED